MMTEESSIRQYNYDAFTQTVLDDEADREQPPLGKKVTDFPLWQLTEDENEPLAETSLLAVLKQNKLTIVEFGSFT